jgi:hypothetical protein
MASNLSLTIKYVQILCQHLPFTPLNASAACYECYEYERTRHDRVVYVNKDTSLQIESKITNNVIYVIR